MFQRTLTKQGLKFKLSTKVVSGEVSDSGVKLTLEPSKGGDQEHMDADVVLVSAGVTRYPQLFQGLCQATDSAQKRASTASLAACGCVIVLHKERAPKSVASIA